MNSFFQAIRSFLLDYLPKLRGMSENTVQSYRTTLNLFIDFLQEEINLSISQISFSIFNREIFIGFLSWLENNRNCSTSTRNQRLHALRSFFKYSATLDCSQIALHFELKNIPLKKMDGRKVDYLTEDTIQIILNQPDITKPIGLRNQFFMILMYDTGARVGEILKMRVRDLRYDIEHPIAHLCGKGGKTRVVPLLNKTVEHSKRYMSKFHNHPQNEDYLFYTIIHDIKNPMSVDTVASFIKKYGDSARLISPDIPKCIHPHQFRHSHAIHHYRAGMPLNLISEQLGHASVESTKIYAYADTEMKRLALEKSEAKFLSKSSEIQPIWKDNKEMILKLSGLK
ncbi:MAG: site-specific integrase [Clostridiales Family XIII bacterium]|nr:site-specific integrase [Clostridiales Family XIII bacterium]